MFEKSGKKNKYLAKVIFYINLIIAVIILMGGITEGSKNHFAGDLIVTITIIIAVIIVLITWVTSIFMVAFGDLVESNVQILNLLEQYNKTAILQRKVIMDALQELNMKEQQ